MALGELELATAEWHQLRNTQPVKLSDTERRGLQSSCADIVSLWRERATVQDRKQIVRLLLKRVEVEVHNNTERVSVRLHWSGGFESCHEITRTVMRFHQLEGYEQLINRVLELTLAGARSPKVAAMLESEGFRSPRSNTPISASMVQKLLSESRCRQQLNDPPLKANHWRSADLAQRVGIPEKRLKDWVTRGWDTAIQRPNRSCNDCKH